MAPLAQPAEKTVPLYPSEDVAAVLRDELTTAIRRRCKRKGIPTPSDDDDLFVLQIEIDSLSVVELLSSLDDILPFKVTESVVKAGGYTSISEAVAHVTRRVEQKWKKHFGIATP